MKMYRNESKSSGNDNTFAYKLKHTQNIKYFFI